MKVLAYGEILWDIIKDEEHLGGAPFNFAVHVARCGNEASIISRVGNDLRGIMAYNKCKEHGVDNSFIAFDEAHPTGIVEVVLDQGQPDYTIIEDVAYDFIFADPALWPIKKNEFDVFYFGSLIQRSALSAASLKMVLEALSFDHIFYDVNLRKGCYSEAIIKSSLEVCTILKLNRDEVPVVSELVFSANLGNEAFSKAIATSFPKIETIVITAAEEGCYVFERNSFIHVPGKSVTVNDAVGAGDAFSAAFMHVYHKTKNAVAAATVANELGAFVATQRGPVPQYSRDIIDLLNGNNSLQELSGKCMS